MSYILRGLAAVFHLQYISFEKDTSDLLKSLNGDALLDLVARQKRLEQQQKHPATKTK